MSYVFKQLTGLKVEEFKKIVEKVRSEWEKVEKQKKCQGRKFHMRFNIITGLVNLSMGFN